jgi:hypothetical protein
VKVTGSRSFWLTSSFHQGWPCRLTRWCTQVLLPSQHQCPQEDYAALTRICSFSHRNVWKGMIQLFLHVSYLEWQCFVFQSKEQDVTFDHVTAAEAPCSSTPQDSRYSLPLSCCATAYTCSLWVGLIYNTNGWRWHMNITWETLNEGNLTGTYLCWEHSSWIWNEENLTWDITFSW